MKLFTAMMLALATTCLPASAAPPFALVDVKSVYSQLPSTTAMQSDIAARKDALLLDHRAEKLRLVISEMQELQGKLGDKTKTLPEDTRLELARNYESKRQIAQTMQKEFEKFRAEQVKEINREMVAAMRITLNKISETAAKIGQSRGFVAVLDRSGETNTGIPFVLYTKEPIDLTAAVVEELMKSEPPPVPATTPATSTPETPEP